MPKPKGKRGLKRFTFPSHDLSDRTKNQLAQILGCRALPQAVQSEIEVAVGLAVHGAEHLDNPPRPTDYISEFTRVRSDAFNLAERLARWDYYYREEFDDAELSAIQEALARLFDASTAIVRRYEELGPNASKGASRQDALRLAVERLCEIFEDQYGGPLNKRTRQGAFQYKATWETSQVDFVEVALLDAGAIQQHYADSKLPRLIRQIRAGRDDPGEQ